MIPLRVESASRQEGPQLITGPEGVLRCNSDRELDGVGPVDTPELEPFDAGVVLRARLTHGGADGSTVKLRPVDPTTVSDGWKISDGFEIELDTVGDTTICSAKLSVDQDRGEIQEVASGESDTASEEILASGRPVRGR